MVFFRHWHKMVQGPFPTQGLFMNSFGPNQTHRVNHPTSTKVTQGYQYTSRTRPFGSVSLGLRHMYTLIILIQY